MICYHGDREKLQFKFYSAYIYYNFITIKLKIMPVDFKTKVLHEAGTIIVPIRGTKSSFKCFRDGTETKISIELTFKEGANLQLLGEIKDKHDHHILTQKEIEDQPGWIFFPKFDKDATAIQDGKAHFIHDFDDKVSLNLSIQLKDGGKTQSAQ
jgi:hypothetical protein